MFFYEINRVEWYPIRKQRWNRGGSVKYGRIGLPIRSWNFHDDHAHCQPIATGLKWLLVVFITSRFIALMIFLYHLCTPYVHLDQLCTTWNHFYFIFSWFSLKFVFIGYQVDLIMAFGNFLPGKMISKRF